MIAAVDRGAALPRLDIAREDALARARESDQPAILSVCKPLRHTADPLAFLAAASATLGDGVLWTQPGGASFAGAGAAADLRAAGPGRFGAVTAALGDLRRRVVRAGAVAPFPLSGGFAFAAGAGEETIWVDLPDALLRAPRVLLQTVAGGQALRISVPVTPDATHQQIVEEIAHLLDRARSWSRFQTVIPGGSPCGVVSARSIPEREAWQGSVATAVSLTRLGLLETGVLARAERLHAPAPFSAIDTLARLRAADPAATLFALQSGKSWFLGATPERLVRLDRGRVDVTCLAGSIAAGATPQERASLAARLLASEKDRREHEIVVASTLAALQEVCAAVKRAPGTPRVTVARSVQHLETPIAGRLAAAGHVLDLVERLHPTPAVGGYPQDEALTLIRELEAIERGWYAGPFGWTDLDGSGEFSVAIRSALLHGRSASLFAGGGIVADSDPAAEFAETCLKLRPMLAALGAA
jgi:isochorismate synthase